MSISGFTIVTGLDSTVDLNSIDLVGSIVKKPVLKLSIISVINSSVNDIL